MLSQYKPNPVIHKVDRLAEIAGRSDDRYFKVGIFTALVYPDDDPRDLMRISPSFNTPEQWRSKISGFDFVKSLAAAINQ